MNHQVERPKNMMEKKERLMENKDAPDGSLSHVRSKYVAVTGALNLILLIFGKQRESIQGVARLLIMVFMDKNW